MGKRRTRRDLLSDLPISIIESILVCLPIKDAIRTSILSTKWRFRWTTIPHLDFHESYRESPVQFRTLVTHSLLRHKGPLQKFSLEAEIDSCTITDQWLLSLLSKDIKELILSLNEEFDVPSCLYLFQNLTLLHLEDCTLRPPPPTFKGFPWLRTLIIESVEVPILTLQSIVEQSPLLETVECVASHNSASELIIRAPNLKNLTLEFYCYSGKNVYYYAPLLAKLSLSVDYDRNELHEKATYCKYTKFLGSFANLETLIGGGDLTKNLSFGIEQYYKHPLVFHRLNSITLGKVNFKSMDEILVAVRLIVDASATLCNLQLRSYDIEEEDTVSAHFWDSICPQNCTFGKLKSVRVEDFDGRIQQMNFIKFLLANSPVLEMLKVKPAYDAKRCMLNSRVKLSSYPRASSSASILFEV